MTLRVFPPPHVKTMKKEEQKKEVIRYIFVPKSNNKILDFVSVEKQTWSLFMEFILQSCTQNGLLVCQSLSFTSPQVMTLYVKDPVQQYSLTSLFVSNQIQVIQTNSPTQSMKHSDYFDTVHGLLQ